MSCLPRPAVVASSLLLLLLAAAGCESTIIDSEGIGDDGLEDGADGSAAETSDDGYDAGGGSSSEEGEAGYTGSLPTDSRASCEAAPVPDDAACEATVSPLDLDQDQAAAAFVGRWLRCNPEAGGLFVTGVVFFANGRAQLLHEDSGDLVCREGFDEGGEWFVENHCGIGVCDEYSFHLTWDDDSWSPMHAVFGNDGDVLRIVNGGGTDEDFIRIP